MRSDSWRAVRDDSRLLARAVEVLSTLTGMYVRQRWISCITPAHRQDAKKGDKYWAAWDEAVAIVRAARKPDQMVIQQQTITTNGTTSAFLTEFKRRKAKPRRASAAKRRKA